jgi:ribokinase
MKQSVNSVVLFDNECQRRTFCDLKDLQSMTYPTEYFEHAARECTFIILCNTEFCRPLLAAAAKYKKEKLLATDVQTITDIDDEYNKDFIAAADIVFFSHENLTDTPEATAQSMMDKYGTSIVVCGLGKEGALLAVKDDNYMERIPAIDVRPVINTVGAGEALFSCFCHLYNRTKDPYTAIKKAVLYAGYKVGASGASDGLMDERDLNTLAEQYIK